MITFTVALSSEESRRESVSGPGVYRRVFGYSGSIGTNDKALSGSAVGGMLGMMIS